jgi:hypothetical protein
LDLPLFAPAQKMSTGQLRPVVTTNRFRFSPTFDHRLAFGKSTWPISAV